MLSGWEIVTLAVIALVVFGPERLPEIARNIGKTVSRVRAEANATLDELKRASQLDEVKASLEVEELQQAASTLDAEARAIGASAQAAAADVDRAAAPYDPDAT